MCQFFIRERRGGMCRICVNFILNAICVNLLSPKRPTRVKKRA
ncbi:MAG TPA: hypothetical protein PLI57_10340 [Spirochaetota bacterium]|nr:hypothetical protein [Spirochaetota bacterium]